MAMDRRGNWRGGCKDVSCPCSQYHSLTGLRCTTCGHPPTKHAHKPVCVNKRHVKGTSSAGETVLGRKEVETKEVKEGMMADENLEIKSSEEVIEKEDEENVAVDDDRDGDGEDSDKSEDEGRREGCYDVGLNTRSFLSVISQDPTSVAHGAIQNHTGATLQRTNQDFVCSLDGCQNRRYVDESGIVHECCSFSHAMELQRRNVIASVDQMVKGLTHCLLPNCHQIVWPFMNYCSRTHADIGIKEGLIPPCLTTSNNEQEELSSDKEAKDEDTCFLPQCKSKRYVDEKGTVHPFCTRYHAQLADHMKLVVPIPPAEKCIIPECNRRRFQGHPYCSRTHADEGKSRGIYLTTDDVEEQCELEGCTRARCEQDGRKHNYCCREHAENDVNAVIRKKDDVDKWLKQFANLTIVSLVENPSAKPGGELFKKFHAAWKRLSHPHRKTTLAFHGTSSTNISSICSQGFDPSKRGQHGQASGPGEYFSTNPATSMGYCSQGKEMLLCELLLGQEGTDYTKHGNVIVMKEPVCELPRFILRFR